MNKNTDFDAIVALDLDPIKVKLMHRESGEGWSLEQATAVEFEYRRFLYLMKKFPNEQTAPLFDVDIFWHYHILDTAKYAEDCELVFGYFLHHFPYIGLRGEDDLEAHHRVGERMRELYEQTFSEAYGQELSMGGSDAGTGTAFSGAGSAVAFSGATVAAHLAASSTVAFSGATAGVAFSGATAKPPAVAFSGASTRTAFSGASARTAFSGASSKLAFSGASTKTAFSGASANFAFSGATLTTTSQDFYATRPRLTATI